MVEGGEAAGWGLRGLMVGRGGVFVRPDASRRPCFDGDRWSCSEGSFSNAGG